MKIDELLQRNEKVLQRGGTASAATIRYSLLNAGLVIAVPFLFIGGIARQVLLAADTYDWIDGGKWLMFFCLIPFFCYLIYSIGQYFALKAMEYCVTNKGVYLQTGTGKKTSVIFVPYAHIREISCDAETLDYGNVTCTLRRENDFGSVSVSLKHVADYQGVKDIIVRQLALYREAEQKALRRSADAHVPAEAVPLLAVTDAFDAPLPDDLPEETVADLQAELFGADAAQQGAFPDPTVNPLPELPESQQGQFLQQQ